MRRAGPFPCCPTACPGTHLPASNPTRVAFCWHPPQPVRLVITKGNVSFKNAQSDFPALLPVTKCLVKQLILFSHRNMFPFKSLIRGGGGKQS